MKDDEMDRILSRQDEILPSSGFTASVMDAVRREAAAPPPIPFPWKRALPGLIVIAFALILVAIVGVIAIAQLMRGPLSPGLIIAPQMPTAILHGEIGAAVSWSCVALLLAFVSVRLSMRLNEVTSNK